MGKNQTKKDLDGWIEVCITDPITYPLVGFCSRYISKNPLFYTLLSFIAALVASWCILKGNPVYAGWLYLLAILLDGLDGKVARYNDHKTLVHGVIDVLSDVIKNGILMFAIATYYSQYAMLVLAFVLIFLVYEYTYSMRLDLKSRYFSGKISTQGYSMNKLKSQYESQIKTLHIPFLDSVLKVYNVLFSVTSKFRTYPYPTIVDAEFILLVLFPLTQNVIFLYLAIIAILPDTIISLVLTLLLTTRAEKNTQKN